MSSYIIIPAHNEEKSIGFVIKETRKFNERVIVIDDGSIDDTVNVACEEPTDCIRLTGNHGKGYAMREGCMFAMVSKSVDSVIILDADLQHSPSDIPKFIKALETNDIVFGYRTFNKNMPLLFRIGNWGLNMIMSVFFKRFKDLTCGYVAFKLDCYEKLKWESNGYNVETEIKINTIKNKLKYTEIPIETIYKDKNKGTGIMDGISICLFMLRSKFK